MYNEDLNLRTRLKISGVEHELELYSVEKGKYTQIRLDQDIFDLQQKPMVSIEKPGVSVEVEQSKPAVEQTSVKPEQTAIVSRSWTSAEDQIIRDKYNDYSLDEIVEKKLLPNRTKSSIANRIHRLQIYKNFTKDRSYKKRSGKISINFNNKILAKKDVKVFEQCFNNLVFKVEDQEFFNNKFVLKILKIWYKGVLDVDLSKKTKSAKKHYIQSYVGYGIDHGFFERIGYDKFRFKKPVKVVEKVDEVAAEKVKAVSDSKPTITIVSHDGEPVKGFTEHAANRIKEISERKRLYEKEIGKEEILEG